MAMEDVYKRQVLKGELPVHCHAHRADDIATAVRIAKEFGLHLVVVHGTEAYLISDLLAQEGIPVITGPCLTDRSKPELGGQNQENPVILAKAGVKVAICTDHPAVSYTHLEEETCLRRVAGVAVVGAHQPPGSPRVLQHLHCHASQGQMCIRDRSRVGVFLLTMVVLAAAFLSSLLTAANWDDLWRCV